jgi:tRNA dimethylallyltransferase
MTESGTSNIPVVCLAGPTASGKTALAFEMVDRLAETIPVELVSVDSAQVFRDMDIGTAKPDRATLARYPHHLIDLITPEASYSAGAFLRDARRVVDEIRGRGHLPLLVGGTMLYFKVLIDGLSALPPADPAMRRAIEDEAAARGWPALHAELAARDPEGAARIDPMHSQRIQRALELVRTTGRPLAELYAGAGDDLASSAPSWPSIRLALFPDQRAPLHERINRRFQDMLAAGLLDEVAALRRRYALHPELPSMRCVGYRQAWEYLDGSIDRAALVERGCAATRQLAKRQITWLRSLPFERIDPASPEAARGVTDRVRRSLDDVR